MRAGEASAVMAAPDLACPSVEGERRVRVLVPQAERGRHFVTFADPAGGPGLRRYVMASKSGSFATLAAGDFHWVATFPPDAAGSPATVVVAIIESGSWVFSSKEACLTYGLLPEGQPEPRLPPQVGEFGGIEFELRPLAASGSGGGPDSVAFVPERLELPPPLQEAYRRYYAAYAAVDGHELSFAAVQRMPRPSMALTYGEAHFLPTHRLLAQLGVGQGDFLVDLGSGTGRLVLAAALSCPGLRRCWGIELLGGLHEAAERTRAQLQLAERVELTRGDFLAEDWSEATVVFAMSLCFPEDLLAGLERRALALREGARLVVMHGCFGELLLPEEAEAFEPVALRAAQPRHAVPTEMSFGETPLYVYRRVGRRAPPAPRAGAGAAHSVVRLGELD